MSNKREVPQFINIEDKIAFQLTAKQLGWAALGGVIIFFLWFFLESTYFFIWSFVVAGAVLAILFVHPYGMTVPVFIKSLFLYIFKPKIYVWRRKSEPRKTKSANSFKKEKNKLQSSGRSLKNRNLEKIKKATKVLDIFTRKKK
ncbi:MAG: PrgI family protein [Candidatus Moranbacteria bacterium]|nr:PrgI family protein [Candidatus Moranbacteria bacterium]